MSQTDRVKQLFVRPVPRRTGWYLFINNNIEYIAAIPILTMILFLHSNFFLIFGLELLAIFCVFIFRQALHLEIDTGSASHPHHQKWKQYKGFLRPFASFVQQRRAWEIGLAGWIGASLFVLAAVWSLSAEKSLAGFQSRWSFDLYWLAYIPSLMWIGYRAQKSASRWFTLFWFLSAISYSVCYFVVNDIESFNQLIDWLILIAWFLFLAVANYYALRRIANFRGQAELVQEVTEKLRNDQCYSEAFDTRPFYSGPNKHLNEIAQYIGQMLSYDRVFILVRDPESDHLFIKGSHGIDTHWAEKGWSIHNQVSITGWVALNKTDHLCTDTSRCKLYYRPEQSYPCRSEATVPILVEGECMGIIDIQSEHLHAFTHSDIRLLWQIANSIGAALTYERHVSREVDKAYLSLRQATNTLVNSKNLDEALKEVARKVREIFGADLVIIYKHAVTTCVPLPGLIVDGEALFPDLFGRVIPKDSRVNELIRRNEDVYIQSYADQDPFLVGPNNGEYDPHGKARMGNEYRFVRREKIQSMIYIKLGLGREIVGSLFLNYRHRTIFQSRMIESLKAFAHVLALSLILKRQVERAIGPLAGSIPLAHSTAQAAFESVSRDFNEIDWGQIGEAPDNQRILDQINTYRKKLDELRLQWNNLILVEQVNLHRSSLVEPITHLETKLRALFPNIRFEWDSRQFLNIPTDELGEVIYKVIAEAVSNALVHAQANRISIESVKQNQAIQISIINNGQPIKSSRALSINELMFEPYTLRDYEKPTGIIPILLDAHRWFGAEWNFSHTDSAGTRLTVLFPMAAVQETEEMTDENERDF